VELIRGYCDSQDVDEYGSMVTGAETLDRLHMHGKRAYDISHNLNLLRDAKGIKRAAAIGPERVASAQIADERRANKVETFCCPTAILKTLCETKCCSKLCVKVLHHVFRLLFNELLLVHSKFVTILNIISSLMFVQNYIFFVVARQAENRLSTRCFLEEGVQYAFQIDEESACH